jgi:hypothetical protein
MISMALIILNVRRKWVVMMISVLYLFCAIPDCIAESSKLLMQKLRFGKDGMFKILLIALTCILQSMLLALTSTLPTTFIQRIILAKKPNLIVFAGIMSSLPLLVLLDMSQTHGESTGLMHVCSK